MFSFRSYERAELSKDAIFGSLSLIKAFWTRSCIVYGFLDIMFKLVVSQRTRTYNFFLALRFLVSFNNIGLQIID